MMYSSGNDGPAERHPAAVASRACRQLAPLPAKLRELYGFDGNTIYLSTAPLYHAAPLKFNLAVQACGGTSIVMEKFDAADALQCLDRYGVTHSQWVPTMFIRLLKLPEASGDRMTCRVTAWRFTRRRPCPVDVKQAMLDWWGPIVLRVLQRFGEHRALRDHAAGMAVASRLGRAAGARCAARRRRRRRRSCRPARPA